MYTKREAAEKLGIDRKTLDKWLEALGINPTRDGRDGRLRVLSEEDVRTIRERYADRHTFSASFTHRPQTLHTSSADLAARVAALEATIERLQQRAPYLFTETRHNANLAAPAEPHNYIPPSRPSTSTASHSRTPARPPVPSHLMSLPMWTKLHGMKIGTTKTWREKQKVPFVRGQWMEGNSRIDTALTLEGREIAHQLAGIPWPCAKCATVEEADNETPHTAEGVGRSS